MNPQMQQYRQYAQAQTRSPANARRPGECDPSTGFPFIQRVVPQYAYQYPGHYQQMASPYMRGGQAPYQTLGTHPLLQSFQQSIPPPRVSSINPAQLHRIWNSMTAEQRSQYIRARAQHDHDLLLQEEIYLHQTGGMQGNPNQAAAQHQRQIYEQQMAQRNAALEHQLAQRRARKPTDRNMPEGMEDLIIGDGVQQYKELRDIEKKLDYAMMRKRLDIQDTVTRSVKRQKTMRIWISNSVENQPWQRPPLDENSFDFDSGADATYKVKIEGRLIEDSEDDILASDEEDAKMTDGDDQKKEKQSPADRKFSHYFKSISVEFDKLRNAASQNPNVDPAMQIEWKKTPQAADVDCIEFTRKGDENLNITVNFVRDEQLERYRLSQALAGTLDMEEADRAEVVMGIWEYVKAMGLQEDEERRLVRCDERLKGIFGSDSFLFPQVADRIMPHLHPLTPIKLQYTIRVDQDFFASQSESSGTSTPTSSFGEPTVYDISITTSDPLRTHLITTTQSQAHQQQTLQTLRQISVLDDQLATLIQSLSHHKARHQFFKSFAKDPIAFLKRWQTSQSHDLAVLLGEVERWDVGGLEFAKGGSDGVWGDGPYGNGSTDGVEGGLVGREGVVREIVRGRLGREGIGAR